MIGLPPDNPPPRDVQRQFVPTSRELQRLLALKRSPVFTVFSEAIAGAATIRAYGRAAHFCATGDAALRRLSQVRFCPLQETGDFLCAVHWPRRRLTISQHTLTHA